MEELLLLLPCLTDGENPYEVMEEEEDVERHEALKKPK